MPVAIVSGSGGLIGSEAVGQFSQAGLDVVGIENDSRGRYFGPEGSTKPVTQALLERHPRFRSLELDVRDADGINAAFARRAGEIELVVHTAAQPSHDWAAHDPATDFEVNANGTLNMLEAARRHAPDATFVHCSTNKVYGDAPNRLPLVESETRLDLPTGHRYWRGIDTTMSIDRSLHSLFGASKAAADLIVQEYGRYFGMKTVCFRAGCVTGPAHAGTRDHGFLSYLVRCAVRGEPYLVLGYDGKQVRDNLHAADLVAAFAAFHARPSSGAVYNIGGGRDASCSVLEAIELCQDISGRRLEWSLEHEPRVGDHRWWITDLEPFQAEYPDWAPEHDLETILRGIHVANAERWLAAV